MKTQQVPSQSPVQMPRRQIICLWQVFCPCYPLPWIILIILFTSLLESEEGGSSFSTEEEFAESSMHSRGYITGQLFLNLHHCHPLVQELLLSRLLTFYTSKKQFTADVDFFYPFCVSYFRLIFCVATSPTLVRALTFFTSRFSKLCVEGLEFLSVLALWICLHTSRTTLTKYYLFLFLSFVVGMKTTRLLWRCVQLGTSLLSCTKNRFLACATPYLLSFFPVRLLLWLLFTQFG